jgi:hypothetical protein
LNQTVYCGGHVEVESPGEATDGDRGGVAELRGIHRYLLEMVPDMKPGGYG